MRLSSVVSMGRSPECENSIENFWENLQDKIAEREILQAGQGSPAPVGQVRRARITRQVFLCLLDRLVVRALPGGRGGARQVPGCSRSAHDGERGLSRRFTQIIKEALINSSLKE